MANSNCQRRTRNFSLVSYLSIEQLSCVLLEHDRQIKQYAYILHDKDDKQEHIHLILCLVNATSITAVRSWFAGFVDEKDMDINTLVQECHDYQSAYLYLTHNTEQAKKEGKHLYNEEDVYCSNFDYFKGKTVNSDDNITLALEEILNGVPLKDVALKYGRDFIIHYHSIKSLINDIGEFNYGNNKR